MHQARFYLPAIALHLLVLFWVYPSKESVLKPTEDKPYLDVSLFTNSNQNSKGPDSGSSTQSGQAAGPTIEEKLSPVTELAPTPTQTDKQPAIENLVAPAPLEPTPMPEIPAPPSPEPEPIPPAPVPPTPPIEVSNAEVMPEHPMNALLAAPTSMAGVNEINPNLNGASGRALRRPTITPPSWAENKQSPYPDKAMQLGEEGTVVMQAHINEFGHVDQISLKKSSGFPILDEAALAHTQASPFHPARMDGQPIVANIVVTIVYERTPQSSLVKQINRLSDSSLSLMDRENVIDNILSYNTIALPQLLHVVRTGSPPARDAAVQVLQRMAWVYYNADIARLGGDPQKLEAWWSELLGPEATKLPTEASVAAVAPGAPAPPAKRSPALSIVRH